MRLLLGLLLVLAVGGAAWLWLADSGPARSGPGVAELAAQRSAAEAPGTLSDAVISRADLPPEGTRSLFDHLIAQNGGLPFPFEKLTDLLATLDGEGRRPNSLMIPDGRSLLKGFADFAKPRIVVSADMQPPAGGATLPPLYRGRLFLGFVEAANEIEVISYNEAAGRFEFQLVEDYCQGCVPRIVYAQRDICLTCHAGAVPIFPVRPWEETNAQPAISQRLREHIGASHYRGEPVQRKLENAERFDNLTDIGGVLPTTQRIWLDGCGEGAAGTRCRRQMLRLALQGAIDAAAFDAAASEVQALREMQASAWPAAGIILANGDLAGRNPLQQDLYQDSLLAQLRRVLFGGEVELLRGGDKLSDFDQLPKLPPEFDPLTRRPPKAVLRADALDGVYGIGQLFSQADLARLEQAAAYDSRRLADAVEALDEALFAPAPARRAVLLPALLAALGEPAPPHCCSDVSEMSPPLVQGEPPLELAAGSPLKPFETYCFGCHRGNPAARLDFMSGPDEATVAARIAEVGEIREVLDYERYLGTRKAGMLMPPEDSWQRKALDQALAKGDDPLQAMREQVPSLFDF